MDNLSKTLNNVSLYDVKAYVRKAQNAVLNLSEMEAKVREATNNDPWGTSTTLMAEIAKGTFNYREREEISNMIFRRFTEKTTREWRQIYKALQLMEYLVRHGSERFVDDARANVRLVSLVTNLHYVDSKGVDQGTNVRHRARELVKLLNDENRIREERKKAKETSKKFAAAITSTSSDSYSGSSHGGRRLGSSSTYGRNVAVYDEENDEEAYSSRVFGDGGVYGQRFEEQRPAAASKRFEEYNIDGPATNHSQPVVSTSQVNASSSTTKPVDLFSFDSAPSQPSQQEEAQADDDDEFDDFQSADATPAAATAPSNNLADLLTSSYSQPVQQQPQQQFATSFIQPVQQQSQQQYTQTYSQPPQQQQQQSPIQSKKKDDVFGSLFASAKTQSHVAKPTTTTTAPASTKSNGDDLFGSFSTPQQSTITSAPTPQSSNNTSNQQNSNSNDIIDLLSF